MLELGDPVLVAAMAMRKLQALHLLSTPGVRTTTDVVVAIVQDLQRALIQAPHMRLRLAASAADWDAELAALDDERRADERGARPRADEARRRGRPVPPPARAASWRPWTPSWNASDGEIRFLE